MVRYDVNKRRNAILFVYLTVVIDFLGLMLTVPILTNLTREIIGEPSECIDESGGIIGPDENDACDDARNDIFANVGLVNNLYAGGSFISSIVMPILSDKYGRKLAFLASLSGSIFGFVGMGVSVNFPMLLAIRFIAGLFGGSATVANAYITDVYPPEERGGMFARLGATIMTAVMLGPTLGGTLANVFGLRGPLWFATALGGAALISASKFIVDPHEVVFHDDDDDVEAAKKQDGGEATNDATQDAMEKPLLGDDTTNVFHRNKGGDRLNTSDNSVNVTAEPGKQRGTEQEEAGPDFNPWMNPAIVAIGFQTFCTTIGFNGITSLMSLLILEDRYGVVDLSDSIEQQGKDAAIAIGLNAGAISIATLPSMLILFGFFTRKIGLLLTGTIGSAFFGAALFILPYTQSELQLLLALLLLGIGNGCQSNVSTTFLAERAPPDHVARTLAVGSLCDAAAAIVGPFLTQLYRFGDDLPYKVAALTAWCGGCTLLCLYLCTRTPPKDKKDKMWDGEKPLSSLGMQLGEPILDTETLQAVMFKGIPGVDYKQEFAEDFCELIRVYYATLEKKNHLQGFRAGVFDDQHNNGERNIRMHVLQSHKEMIQRAHTHFTRYEDDKDKYMQEVQAVLTTLGHDDWARGMNSKTRAGLQRVASMVPVQ